PCVPFTTSAASGIRTTTLRYPSAIPLDSVGAPRARRRTLGSRAASTASGDSERLLDLRDDARRRIEELLVHLRPPPDVPDLEELRPRRKLSLELAEGAQVGGAEAVLRPDRLCRRRVEPAHELLGLRLVSGVERCNRSLDLQGRLRDQVVDGLALRLGELRV